MDRRVLNNKILFELLSDDKQPQKTIFNTNATMLKLGRVVSVGDEVEKIKKGDIITVYVTTIFMLDGKMGFCSQRDIIFTNDIPAENKVHVKHQSKEDLSLFDSAIVVNSNSKNIDSGDKIFFRKGQSHILPDNTEIISDSQIYYKEG